MQYDQPAVENGDDDNRTYVELKYAPLCPVVCVCWDDNRTHVELK